MGRLQVADAVAGGGVRGGVRPAGLGCDALFAVCSSWKAVVPVVTRRALQDASRRNRRPAQRYGVGGCCGERSTSRVISLGAKTRKGGPQKPVPRLV